MRGGRKSYRRRRRNRWSKHRGDGRNKSRRWPCWSRWGTYRVDGQGSRRHKGRQGGCGTDGHAGNWGDRCDWFGFNHRNCAGNRDRSDRWWKEGRNGQRLRTGIGPKAIPSNRNRQGDGDHHPIVRASPVCHGIGFRSCLAADRLACAEPGISRSLGFRGPYLRRLLPMRLIDEEDRHTSCQNGGDCKRNPQSRMNSDAEFFHAGPRDHPGFPSVVMGSGRKLRD